MDDASVGGYRASIEGGDRSIPVNILSPSCSAFLDNAVGTSGRDPSGMVANGP
jgi:hypothetical protein